MTTNTETGDRHVSGLTQQVCDAVVAAVEAAIEPDRKAVRRSPSFYRRLSEVLVAYIMREDYAATYREIAVLSEHKSHTCAHLHVRTVERWLAEPTLPQRLVRAELPRHVTEYLRLARETIRSTAGEGSGD